MRKTVRWLVVVAMMMTMLPMSVLPAGANGGPLVAPEYIDISNFKLTDPPANCEKEYKFDSGDINAGASGTYTMTFEDVPACDGSDDVGDVTVTVTIDGRDVSFVVDGGKTGVVYVKGGPGGNLYDYRTMYPGGVTEDSGLTTPGGDFGVSHVSFCLCSDAKVQKDWEFTAPAGADAGWTYKAYYSEDPTDSSAWVAVDLADADKDGVYTGTTYHDEDAEIWWKWRVYDGMTLLFESAVEGPETLVAPGPHTNDFTIVLKSWEFTAPDAFADRGYVYKAYYSENQVDWVAVDLADADMDGVWTAKTLFDVDTEIWWKWRVYDGTDVVFESPVDGPETLAAPGPYANDFAICLKSWTWTPSSILTQLLDSFTISGFYKIGEGSYVEVPMVLNEVTGAYEAETIFECDTAIMYYFEVKGYDTLGGLRYLFASEPAPETIKGRATVTNAFDDPQLLKLWKLEASTPPDGGTYYAAFRSDESKDWIVVPLTHVPDTDYYVGSSALIQGLGIWYKFYDASWETLPAYEVLPTGQTSFENYVKRNGVTRTIGYWQTHVCMATDVFNEKLSATIDLGWTTLYSIEEVMAVLNYPQMPGANKLSNFNKAKLQTSRQLVAATLNEGLGTSVPMIDWYGTNMSIIEAARLALASGNLADIRMIGEKLDEFNNSGTEEWLPDWKPDCWNNANPKLAVELGIVGWPAVKAEL